MKSVVMMSVLVAGTLMLSQSTAPAAEGAHKARKTGGNQNGVVHNEQAQQNQEQRQARKAERQKKMEETKARREATKEELQQKGAERVDKRQDNQDKRINHGIKKGYLTDDEVAKLQTQQQNIATLEASALADSKITRDEFKSIQSALNEASRCIWAEKHDTDGTQMATYRLGKNVFARADLTAQLANEDLSPDQAKALLKDFRSLTEMKRKLSTDNLSDAERAALQQKYDDLLNQYFEVR